MMRSEILMRAMERIKLTYKDEVEDVVMDENEAPDRVSTSMMSGQPGGLSATMWMWQLGIQEQALSTGMTGDLHMKILGVAYHLC